MKPDRQLARDLEGGQSEGMIVGMRVRGLVPSHADLVKQVHGRWRHCSLHLQPTQEVSLLLFYRRVEADPSRNFLCQQLAELAELDRVP